MAAGSLLLLLDDIASALDDVAALTKAAAAKTAAVVGDDLAVNAQQLSGLRADRELRVVAAVALGSLRNKMILVPGAIALGALAPGLVVPLLAAVGIYLCYEGAEKVAHSFAGNRGSRRPHADAADEPARIRAAVRTDFVLSAEIIAITLGAVASAPRWTQAAVLATVGVLMTAGVYGLVAAIVKLDDLGLHLTRTATAGTLGRARRSVGRGLLAATAPLMRLLAFAGTLAMFLVGGGILAHALAPLGALHGPAGLLLTGTGLPAASARRLGSLLADGAVGVCAGAAAVGGVTLARRIRS